MPSLAQIRKPIIKELNNFDRYFGDLMGTRIPLLNLILKYLLNRKGKQIRPILVFLTAKLLGEPNSATNIAAALIELMHTATLIHDDVVDDSYERRGFFSIRALWKSKVSVLVGDYMLAKGLMLAMQDNQQVLLELVSMAMSEMIEGELLQMKNSRKVQITEKEYFEVIRKKTAALISCCSACGATSVNADESVIKKMQHFGELLGIAFQIKDDLFDYQHNRTIGKPSWNDLKDNKLTLPLIYALNQASKSEANKIIRLLHNKDHKRNKYNYIIDFVEDLGGTNYATEKMNEISTLALQELGSFSTSEAKKSLQELVTFAVSRVQ